MTSRRIAPAVALAAWAATAAFAAGDPPPPPATQTGEAAPQGGADSEVDALRREVQALREQIEELRARLDAALSASAANQAGTTGAPSAAPPPAAPPPAAPPPAGTAEAGAAAQPPPAASPAEVPAPPPEVAAAPPVAVAPPARSQNTMNPAISAVFQLIGNTSVDRREDANGFDLSEAEVAFESTVDPYAKVNLYLSFPSDASPEVEEGYALTLSMPAALQLKGGRFKSAFGKWNTYHTHAFFTVDRPDVLVNFFGEESLTNDGLSLSWLIPNPWGLYIDSITEAGTARESVAFNSASRALTWTQHLAAFFNTSDSSTLEGGLTVAGGRTGPSDALLSAIDAAGLTGTLEPDTRLDSLVTGIDLTWKWKPLQQNTFHSFLWQTEALRSRRDEQVLDGTTLAYDHVVSGGGYTYLEGQWTKRWKAGLRYDLSGFPDSTTAREWGTAAVVKFIPTEFQEIRFQIEHTRYNEEAAARFDGQSDDTRLYFEWIPVIGAHGAHKY